MYKIVNGPLGGQSIQKISDGISLLIPIDEANADYQDYLQWLAAGNTPDPPDPPPPPVEPRPSLADRVEAAETIIDLLLMEGE
jgi:hypothetical protein